MKSIKVNMTLTKETKNTYMFSDSTQNSVIPTLYVNKSAFGKSGAPNNIQVLVKAATEE